MRMKLTLPDKSVRELPEGSSGYDLAKDIGSGLAKAAVAIEVDGTQQDLHDSIEKDSTVSIWIYTTYADDKQVIFSNNGNEQLFEFGIDKMTHEITYKK